MTLRRLKREDGPHLRELLESTKVFGKEEIDTALEIVDDILEQRDDYEAFVAADESDLPVGFAIYGPTPMTDSTWDLYWIATHASAHGRGIGSAVMARVEEDVVARKGRMIRIETSGRDAYGPTRGFYERTNYRAVGVFPNFYRPGDDLVILAKDLGVVETRVTERRPAPARVKP